MHMHMHMHMQELPTSHLCSLPAAAFRHKNLRKAALADEKH